MSLRQSFLISHNTVLQTNLREAQLAISTRSGHLFVGVDQFLHIFHLGRDKSKSHDDHLVDAGSPICVIFPVILPSQKHKQDYHQTDVVILGLKNGCLLFLDLNGDVLFQLGLNAGAIRSIMTRLNSGVVELCVLSDSAILAINLDDVKSVLLKRVSDLEVFPLNAIGKSSSTFEIRFRKFIPPHGEQFSQFSVYELNLPPMFTHLVDKSIDSPFEQSDASWHALSVQTWWIVAGLKPFISFNASEEIVSSSLRSMLYTEAKRVLLGTKRSKDGIIFVDSDDTKVPIGHCSSTTTTPLRLIHGLSDERRHITNPTMVSSADRRWLSFADSLGRVLLVDVLRRRVVRMWKGYREAELAFVDTADQPASDFISADPTRVASHPRSTRCLFIHAPHRRILEVWGLAHGPRLATWNVEEPVRLIQVVPDLLDNNLPTNSAHLIDSRGVVYTLSVNPELCLAGTDSEAALGYHEHQLMQDCYSCLRSWKTGDPVSLCDELLGLFSKFRTASWCERTLAHVVNRLSQRPHTLDEFLRNFVQHLGLPNTSNDKSALERVELQRIHAICVKLSALVRLYIQFYELNQHFCNVMSQSSDSWTVHLERICDLLSWDPEDASCCLTVYNLCDSIFKPSILLQLSRPIELQSFIGCFTYAAHASRSNFDSLVASAPLQFCPDGSVLYLAKIGSLLFGPFVLGHQSFEALTDCLKGDLLSPGQMLMALTSYILYWEICNNIPDVIYRLHRLYAYLLGLFCRNTSNHLAALADADAHQHPLESLLSQLLTLCLGTVHISSAYLVSLILRSLVYVVWNATEQHLDLSFALLTCFQVDSSSISVSHAVPDSCVNLPKCSNSPHECAEETLSTGSQLLTFDCGQSDFPNLRVSMSDLRALINKWHDTCSQFEGLFFLTVLLQLPATDDVPSDEAGVSSHMLFQISLGRLLQLGRACLTEMFASWLIHWQVEPDYLMGFYHGLCSKLVPVSSSSNLEGLTVKDTRSTNQDPVTCADLSLVSVTNIRKALFPLVYNRLPFTLEIDTVIASVSWLYYSRWLNEPEELHSLKMSIEFMRSLSSAGAMIAQGLGTLMWDGRLRLWYGHCVSRISGTNDEASSTPIHTEKLKYLSMLLVEFMSAYVNACDKAEVVPVFSVEREWAPFVSTRQPSDDTETSDWDSDLPASRKGSDSIPSSRFLIAETATNQPPPDRRCLLSWEQAIIVVSALLVFGCPEKPNKGITSASRDIRRYTPIDFFASQDSSVITTSFAANWISASLNDFSDSSLNNRRKYFLSWLMEQAVLAYRLTVIAAVDLSTERHLRSSSAIQWKVHGPLDVYHLFSSATMTLGKHWGFSKDMLLSCHALFLFESGLDEQAELFLPQIQDKINLASRLLIVIGRRVAVCCFGSASDSAAQLRWRACVPFQLESWLHGLLLEPTEILPVNPPQSMYTSTDDHVARLVRLVDFVLLHLPPQASQYAIAESLRDTLYAMNDEQ